MRIRSITYFLNPGRPVETARLEQAGQFLAAARSAFQTAGYEVQTVRLATVPFPHLLPRLEVGELVHLAQSLEKMAHDNGCEYLSLGPALPEAPDSYALIPPALAATRDVFFSGLLTTPGGGVSLAAVRACAEVIHQAAPVTLDGFTNLRFAALANAPAGTPFFPVAYHQGETPAFALATESADLAVEAFTGAASLAVASRRLVEAVEGHAQALGRAAEALSQAYGVRFGGFDFTLAPFPETERSLGTALERLGVPAVGMHGSLAAAAFLTNTLEQASYPRTGFNGLMLPILEDATLSIRADQGLLSIQELLLYSSVCGTGLDTIPLPGDITAGELAAILLDVAALAQRLDKPLTARLMPIPGKRAGEPTHFDFGFFANSRVVAVRAAPLSGAFAGEETFTLRPRRV